MSGVKSYISNQNKPFRFKFKHNETRVLMYNIFPTYIYVGKILYISTRVSLWIKNKVTYNVVYHNERRKVIDIKSEQALQTKHQT